MVALPDFESRARATFSPDTNECEVLFLSMGLRPGFGKREAVCRKKGNDTRFVHRASIQLSRRNRDLKHDAPNGGEAITCRPNDIVVTTLRIDLEKLNFGDARLGHKSVEPDRWHDDLARFAQ